MDRILELAAVGGVAAEAAHAETAQPAHTQTTCLNCDAHLHGRYCHACGQSSDDHHRSIVHLMWEAVEGFTHLDGRLARTLPALLFRPGQLACDHIGGRRMRHVPPFRLFLITLLVFMFAMEAVVHRGAHATIQHTTTLARHVVQVGETRVVAVHASDVKTVLNEDKSSSPLHRWLKDHIGRAADNHEYYQMLVFGWAHRLAIFMLPILAAQLTLLYVYKKQFYVYDHLIVSMQFLSFCFLVWAVVWILPEPVRGVVLIGATFWTPLNLYLILRGAYGSSIVGAVGKALFLWVSTMTLFATLLVGLLVLALNQM